MDKQDLRNLKKRYLIWLYKTTKEALDKIERKFTQLEVDSFLLKELRKTGKGQKYEKFIEELETYIENKTKDGLQLKYENGEDLKPDYLLLVLKLKAIEKAITAGFSRKFLQEVKTLYEIEMTERILTGTEH